MNQFQKPIDSIKKTELLKYIRDYLEKQYFDDVINWKTLDQYLNVSKIQREIKEKYKDDIANATYTTYEKYIKHLIKQNNIKKNKRLEIKGLDFETITYLLSKKDKILPYYDELRNLLKPFKFAVDLREFLRTQLQGFVNRLVDGIDGINMQLPSDFSFFIYVYFIHIKKYDDHIINKYCKEINWYNIINKGQ